uniref:Uncharacterized protein n=1 Tax=Rhizophora mucronata TaxID=61149 RepID=A0A2P2NP88_RHIMU
MLLWFNTCTVCPGKVNKIAKQDLQEQS